MDAKATPTEIKIGYIKSEKSTPDTPCLKRRSSSQRQREEKKSKVKLSKHKDGQNTKSAGKGLKFQRKMTLNQTSTKVSRLKDGYKSGDISGDDTMEEGHPILQIKDGLRKL